MTHRLEPLAADRTAVECQWLFDPDAVGRDGFDPSYAVDFWDITNRQDWAACEACSAVSRRGATGPGPFGLDEDAVQPQFVRTRSPTPTSTAAWPPSTLARRTAS